MLAASGSHDQDYEPPHPYMVKTLQNLLWNRLTDFHETWYVASGTPAHHDDTGLTLTYFKVKFGNLGFSIGKHENSGFSEIIAACDDADNYLGLLRYMYVSIQGQGHFLILAQGHLHMKIKTCFSQKPHGHI